MTTLQWTGLQIGWIKADGTEVVLIDVIRDLSRGHAYFIVRRELDGLTVRWWTGHLSTSLYAQLSPRVRGVTSSHSTLIPLDEQYPSPGMLVQTPDGRVFVWRYLGQQWRWTHVPDLATFVQWGLKWADVHAADPDFAARIAAT